MKSDIFYAMNEINDKYIIEAAQCFEYREENADGFLAKPMVITKIEIYKHKWLSRIAVAIVIVLTLFTTGGIVNAATEGKLVQWINDLFGAELVTSENVGLIGKEIIDHSDQKVTHGEEIGTSNESENVIAENRIIKGLANDNIVLPSSISEFEVKNGVTPEIIMTNGSMAVFYLNNYEGWSCKTGDTLTFSFEKYESEVVSNQTLVIGYIRDGILYEGESFENMSGCYELSVKEEGEYNIYIISATSDYLTLKQGSINHNIDKR